MKRRLRISLFAVLVITLLVLSGCGTAGSKTPKHAAANTVATDMAATDKIYTAVNVSQFKGQCKLAFITALDLRRYQNSL